MISRVYILIMSVLVAATAIVGVIFYPQIPNPAPVHWNFHGEADRFGPAWECAFVIPAGVVVLVALLAVLPLLGPFRGNFERFRVAYGRIVVAVVTCLLALQIVFLLKATGRSVHMGAAIAIVFGAMFAVIGNWFGKLRRNLYIGIRTPWTIANDIVWERTHRLGGRIAVIVGAASLITGLINPGDTVCLIVIGGGLGFLAVWSLVYSLVCYRRLGQVDHLSAPGEA